MAAALTDNNLFALRQSEVDADGDVELIRLCSQALWHSHLSSRIAGPATASRSS
jgi:hypothetical protein